MNLLYTIAKGIEITPPNGVWIDVHNNMGFHDFSVNFATQSARVLLHKFDGDWVGPTTPDRLSLWFDQVSYLHINIGSVARTESCIDEIGFKDPDDHDLDWLGDQENNNPDAHVVIRFIGDGFIRIGAELGRLEFE